MEQNPDFGTNSVQKIRDAIVQTGDAIEHTLDALAVPGLPEDEVKHLNDTLSAQRKALKLLEDTLLYLTEQ